MFLVLQVKEGRLAEVMSLLGSAGFDLYLSDPMNLTAQVSAFTSPMLSPAGDDDASSVNPFDLHSFPGSGRNSFDTDGGIVFTRSRSNTNGTTSSSGSRSRSGLPQRMTSPEVVASPERVPDVDAKSPSPTDEGRPASARSISHSPSACDVRVLSPDITCVGLSDDSADTWGLKIVKLVAFPELIVGPSGAPVAERRARPRTPSPVLLSALPEDELRVVSFSEGEAGSGSDTTTRVAPESPKKDPAERCGSESPAFEDCLDGEDSSEDEGEPDIRPKLRHLDTARMAKPQSTHQSSRSRSSSGSSTSESAPAPLVPFFSFTRTQEGSSLAAPVGLLAALFPASERHMVMCSQELDVLDSRNASPERWAEEDEGASEDADADADEGDGDGDLPEPEGMLKCLQIDLRKFGLGECRMHRTRGGVIVREP